MNLKSGMRKSEIIRAALLLLTCLICLPFTALAEEVPEGRILIEVDGLRNTNGYLGILLFRTPDGFPSETSKAFRAYSSTFSSTSETAVIYDIPYGCYAVSVLHDENMNSRLDTNWLGIPKEGVGVSGDGEGLRRRPRYGDSVFELRSSSAALRIQMNYIGN